mmetsp:Transcript_37493/g.41784  ORF Transcript_37493/g.41784 Transcript_37493/m.41784 type:complete len:93 (-) Transcript_37493:1095-1373(-)
MDQSGANNGGDGEIGKRETTEDEDFHHVMKTNHYRRQADQRMDDAEMVLDSCFRKLLDLGFSSIVIDQDSVPQSRSILSHLRCCCSYHGGRG